ncbi:hypothetical protein MNBD_GAMMA21-2432 [hydrothermal vent metagenome]|uniref:GAD-like domain protein n=1 Tax=hydrothermal vent metagenome TaxID=652676 RepID=A0A3B1AFE8_9ZZZZ
MDEYFEEFLNGEGFAPAIECRSVDKVVLQNYENSKPYQLVNYWKEFGFCGYGEGLFWTVNPANYEDVLQMWLGNTPLWRREKFYVIARTAFGELYVRGDKSITTTIIDPHLNNILPGDDPSDDLSQEKINQSIGVFFEVKNKKSVDYLDQNDKPLFRRALKKLGPLKHDEMYTFVPALATGGIADIEHVQKVKIHEQLSLLAELDTPVILKSVGELFGD